MEIESSPFGGARTHLEMLEHPDRIWSSDCIDRCGTPIARCLRVLVAAWQRMVQCTTDEGRGSITSIEVATMTDVTVTWRSRPTIADVARVAGVSQPTVSRVLTGSVPVSAKKRALVMEAIASLGYHPSAAARALSGGSYAAVGVITLNTTRYGYTQTLRGVEEAARSAGYLAVISVVESTDPEEIDSALGLLMGQGVAGVIVFEFEEVGVAAARAIPSYVPVVAAGGAGLGETDLTHALLDDGAGSREATKYLLSLGHRTVHHLAIKHALRSGRIEGWRSALEEAGAPIPEVVIAEYEPESGYAVGGSLVDDTSVTAILAGNDELAVGVMRALGEAGREVPGDVSLIGFDDQPFARMLRPSLTTVSQDFADLGRRAFNLLLERITTGTSPQVSMASPTLVIRESTAPPRR